MNKIISLILIYSIVFMATVSGYTLSGYITNDSVGIEGSYIYYNLTIYNYSDISGYYILDNLTNGDKLINFSKAPTHYLNSSNISISGNTTRNIILNLKPTGTITGCVYVFGGINPCTIIDSVSQYSKRIRWFF